MIRFALSCHLDHKFDGWFRSNEDYEKQQAMSLISCPLCGSNKVGKMLMTPAINTKKGAQNHPAKQKEFYDKIRLFKKQAINVGKDFPKEVRKIHNLEAVARPLIGTATHQEVKTLLEEGIQVFPLPVLPEEKN